MTPDAPDFDELKAWGIQFSTLVIALPFEPFIRQLSTFAQTASEPELYIAFR
jgi:hypothetical protein